MSMIKLSANIDENHQLSATVPLSIRPGPVTVLIIPEMDEDEAGDKWVAGIANEWKDELRDVRQDIYTLADGEPALDS
jgi:hypothetical protein